MAQRILVSAINCDKNTIDLFTDFAKENGFHVLKEQEEHCEQDNEDTCTIYMAKGL